MARQDNGEDLKHLRPMLAASANTATFQWPWDIARKGGEYFSQVGEVATALTSAGQAVADSSDGSAIVASVASDPTDSANTDAVLKDGLFSSALDSIKADELLRSPFIGWAGGAQVGFFGGGGGAGVAYDAIDPSNRAAVTYGMVSLGIGGQIATGLLVGAMTREPSSLTDSTAVFQFGAALVGIGAFASVIMTESNLDLIGFTIIIGVGAGFSSATGYGEISSS
jgi:hypothetical protein